MFKKIMKKTHTYYNRAHTNKHILEEASKVAYPKGDKRIIIFSDFHNQRKAKLLGHIIRSNEEDPLSQITLQPNTAERPTLGKRRVGKPRQNWVKQTKKDIWAKTLNKLSPYTETKQQDLEIYNAAINRQF